MTPRVTIGLPVFNGARYLAASIESMLAQSFSDFELVISDNASTDETGELCRAYAAADDRVRYLRHDTNVGAVENFNSLVPHARGEYFKWLAVDDVCDPSYLAECVAALDAHPAAVLAQSAARYIDEAGHAFTPRRTPIGGGLRPDRGVSWKRLSSPYLPLRAFSVTAALTVDSEFYGVMRTEMLRRTRLNRGYYGDDRTMVLEFALQGPFVAAPPHLWARRIPWTMAMTTAERAKYRGGPPNTTHHGAGSERLVDSIAAVRATTAGLTEHVAVALVRLGWVVISLRVMPKRPSTIADARRSRAERS